MGWQIRLLAAIALFAFILPGAAGPRPAQAVWAPLAPGMSAPTHQPQAAEDWVIPNGHFFTQARGHAPAGQGYAVVDDGAAPFWREFQRLGGVAAVGYPVTRRFVWDGFLCQAFQKVIFQWRPEAGQVYFVNVFDQFSGEGLDDWLEVVRSTPRPARFEEAGLTWDRIVETRLGLLAADPEIQAAYFSAEDWLTLHGLPMAPIADYGNVRVLRAQRVIIQQWLVDTPWAAAGQVVFANGGDLAKEAGLLPPDAVVPEAAPPGTPPAAGNSPPPTPAGPVVPPPDEAARRLAVPPGFAIRIFAADLGDTKARMMTFGPDGALYLTLLNAGQIVRLPDRDRDGLADGVEVAATGLSLPHGLEWHAGWLYVAQGDRVERLGDTDGDGYFESRELVTDNLPPPRGHATRTLHFGPDGKLYVSTGSSCNACEEDDPRRAAILRFNPDGTIPGDNPLAADPDPRRRPLWAWGLRNSVDFLWAPDGRLWASDMGSDGLGDELPPEEIVIPVEGGRHHGWPYCYTPVLGRNSGPAASGEVSDPRLAPPAGFACDQAVPALFTDLAHSAPLGMTLGRGLGFPPESLDDLFVAYHGSWNTSLANARDCEVRRIGVDDGVPVESAAFVTGWRAPGRTCGDPATWGRPADVRVGPDGALYISDDHGGRVYRLVYTG